MKNKPRRRVKTLPGEKKPSVGIRPTDNKQIIRRLLPVMVIILTYTAFFFLLRGKVLFTPDLDRSDVFHLNVALKYHLWESLHQNLIPFWTQQLQGGFPIMAEGQIGALFLPNLLLYRLFSFTDAYMLSFVGSLFLFTLGMYFLFKESGLRSMLALLLSFSASFSGFISFRWVHLNLIQTVSLFPFIFLSAKHAFFTEKGVSKLIFVFLVSQLIFAGHMQIAFLLFLSLVVWYFGKNLAEKKGMRLALVSFLRIALPLFILGGFLSLPQLLPTLELMLYSGRTQQSGYLFATSYSYSPSQLISFITPFFYGNPKFHTYPLSLWDWGVYWENTPYVGEPLFAFILLLLCYFLFKKLLTRTTGFMHLCIAFLFLVISFGSNSPIYFLFDLPPFSLFRTPAKYLIPTVFFLLWGIGYYIEMLLKTKKNTFLLLFVYIILGVNIILLIHTAFSYHVFIDGSSVLSVRTVTRQLTSRERYLTFGFDERWHTYLENRGWGRSSDVLAYKRFNSSIIPNSNFIYGGECFDINTGGLRLRRIDLMNGIFDSVFSSSNSAHIATSSAMKLLQVAGITTVISAKQLPVLNNQIIPVHNDISDLYYYTINHNAQSFYTPKNITHIAYKEDFDIYLSNGKVSTEEAVVEGLDTASYQAQPSVSILQDSDIRFDAEVSSSEEFFFVLAKNWYPGWFVTLDGKQIKPVKTNLIHMGISVPAGNHRILASYIPVAFYLGLVGAAVGGVICCYFCFIRARNRI